MNIRIHSSELNRMLKTISKCTDPRISGSLANIEIGGYPDGLYLHASNGTMIATMTTPMLGLDEETFCVDGSMLKKVCEKCSGEIEIATDGKVCTIKGTGRTRLPIVDAQIPQFQEIKGDCMTVSAGDLTRCYRRVRHAVSSDENRIVLTGVLTENVGGKLSMTALDGFQMSVESTSCDGDDMKMIVPAGFMDLLTEAAGPEETVTFVLDGHRLTAKTEGVVMACGLIAGEYPDVSKILPTEFATECLVKVSEVMDALKSGSVINSKQNLVKLQVGADSIRIMNNSEEADYEADVPCETQGDGLMIAFNQRYLMAAMGAIDGEDAVMCFNSSVKPCVVKEKDGSGVRLVLPVRVAG